MEISDNERNAYLETRIGLSKAVIEEVRQELTRLQGEMEGRLRELVEKAVERVRKLQDDLSIDETERLIHENCYAGKYTEEALDAHKSLLHKLEAKWKVRWAKDIGFCDDSTNWSLASTSNFPTYGQERSVA